MTIVVRSTKNCPNTPRILYGLEELGLAYEVERVADGVFGRQWGSPGPTITDGDVTTIEPGAILRHLSRREGGRLWPSSLAQQADADRWFEFQGRRISRAVDKPDAVEATRLLGFVDAHLTRATWMVGDELTMVDVFYSLFAMPVSRQRMPYLASFAALTAYIERVSARPAFVRALAAADAHLSS